MKLPKSLIKDSDHINVIIETPKGSGNKYAYDPEHHLFKLTSILPQGMVFPNHFGFIPHTKAEDGDPVDVLVLMDEPSYPGCWIECKVLGVIEAVETEDGKSNRNDRIIAASTKSIRFNKYDELHQLEPYEIDEMVNFFVSYNNLNKKEYKHIGNKGSDVALELIRNQT